MPDLKITQLTEETSPVGADLMAIVDDVAGTPTTKKLTLTNLATLMGTLAPGGDSTYTSAHASPPATPGAGDLWLPTDSFYIYRYSGSVWVPWGPIFPMTPPVDGDFAWVNQGGASVTTTNGGVRLSAPVDAGVNIRGRFKAAPSTPYVITAAFIPDMLNVDSHRIGIGFRQSSDGKMALLNLVYDSTGGNRLCLGNTKFTDATTFSAAYAGLLILMDSLRSTLVWFRIADDGANRIVSFSADGQNWRVLHTVGRTDFLTADQVGFFANTQNATHTVGMTLLSWKET